MNPRNTKYLLISYPKLYRQFYLPMTETCMCWGFEFGDGWFEIIDEVSKKIEAKNNRFSNKLRKITYMIRKLFNPMLPLQQHSLYVEAVQVKEKFGSLRFYTNFSDNEVDNWIREAETKSETTCEHCGSPHGKIRKHGWHQCRCDFCEHKHQNPKK